MAGSGNSLKNIAKVSFGTLNSRILGLVRDMLTMAYLGIGAVSSAFFFGFTIPNLFRRLMGEGALSSAFIPVFAHTLRDKGKDEAFSFLNRVITRVFLVLLGLVALGVGISLLYHFAFASEERYLLGSSFAAIMMPYMLFICIAALLCAALNVLGAFTIPALNAVWLNIALIGFTIAGGFIYGADIRGIAKFMCIGALVGGFAQFAIPAWELRRKGWVFKPDLGRCDALTELFKLFLPALVGAGVIQLNMFVINFLALYVDDNAVSAIYVSNRLVEFPLGMFTVAIVTVYFPKLAMLCKSGDMADYSKEYGRGLISVMFISLPAACGLFVLRDDILSLLFEWGKFGSADVATCSPILAISAVGIPLYSLATYSTRGFHSLKDTKTPVKISAAAFIINIGFAVALMFNFGAKGLVAANVVSALFQAIALNVSFAGKWKADGAVWEIAKTLIASVAMLAVVLALRPVVMRIGDGKMSALVACCTLIPAGIAAYAAALFVLRFRGFDEIKRIITRGKQ